MNLILGGNAVRLYDLPFPLRCMFREVLPGFRLPKLSGDILTSSVFIRISARYLRINPSA